MKKAKTVEEKAEQIAAGRIAVLMGTGLLSDKAIARTLERAKEIVASGGVLPIASGIYDVKGSEGGAYQVKYDSGAPSKAACTCDHFLRKVSTVRCKHIFAVEFHAQGASALVQEYREEAEAAAKLAREKAEELIQ